MADPARALLRRLPDPVERPVRRVIRRLRRLRLPVRMGRLRRLTPVAGNWGLERGRPVDRYFIERFVERHRDVIRGRVLEVQVPLYCARFGSGVEHCEILDIDETNPAATLVADLQEIGSLPAGRFDCAIVTQTLQFVDDPVAAVRNLWQALAPGGTLLVTVPTVSKLEESLAAVDRWRLTPPGLEEVLRRACPNGAIEVEGYGNILVSTAFLYGLVTDDLRPAELDHYDPIFPTGVCGRATKPALVP